MRIAILAAGGKNWDRTSIVVRGENIIDRICRQLVERGVPIEDIWISIAKDHSRATFGRTPGKPSFIVNDLTGNDLGCIVGIDHLNFDLYLFGDVYYTDAALDAIIAGRDNFYGRTKASETKIYGEMFAIKPDDRLRSALGRMWYDYTNGMRKRLWSWDLYSEIQGKDFYKHRNTGNFTEITDETEDFDKPAEVDRWRARYE